ncbi:hypothetical protein BC936DRAFT_144607, partial [Jimgerdemannia flammicorona]
APPILTACSTERAPFPFSNSEPGRRVAQEEVSGSGHQHPISRHAQGARGQGRHNLRPQKRARGCQVHAEQIRMFEECYAITGKKLIAKCKALRLENEELGRQLRQGRVEQYEIELALQRRLIEELKGNIGGMCDYHVCRHSFIPQATKMS